MILSKMYMFKQWSPRNVAILKVTDRTHNMDMLLMTTKWSGQSER